MKDVATNQTHHGMRAADMLLLMLLRRRPIIGATTVGKRAGTGARVHGYVFVLPVRTVPDCGRSEGCKGLYMQLRIGESYRDVSTRAVGSFD